MNLEILQTPLKMPIVCRQTAFCIKLRKTKKIICKKNHIKIRINLQKRFKEEEE